MNIKLNKNYKIQTPEGWSDFKGVKKSIIPYHFLIKFTDKTELKGSENHLIQLSSGDFWEISLLIEGDEIFGGKIVSSVECIEKKLEVYDIIKINNSSNSYYSENVIHHNCAFIEGIEDIFASAQQTLSTGGKCLGISTPNGTGNWFHKTFTAAQNKENKFVPLSLPWTVHPERDQSWRDAQDDILGPRLAAQECDTNFSTSGDTVIEPDILNFYEATYIREPMEKRGIDGALWVWEPPDYNKNYMTVADVARGDASDYSTFHVIDIEDAKQVAEYKAQVPTKDFANILFAVATEYNDSLLVVENANIGWSVLEHLIARNYRNLYYSSKSDTTTGFSENQISRMENGHGIIPGFTTSLKTRPLCISKLVSYLQERSIIIQSRRLMDELKVFVWKNGKAQAQSGYNDDLVMPFSIGLFLRDTALKLRQQGVELTRATLGSFGTSNQSSPNVFSSLSQFKNPYEIDNGMGGKENIDWLL